MFASAPFGARARDRGGTCGETSGCRLVRLACLITNGERSPVRTKCAGRRGKDGAPGPERTHEDQYPVIPNTYNSQMRAKAAS